MNHGLAQDTVEKINSVLAQFPEVEAAILYGSRAKGNYKEWSDIDLALTGEIGLPTLFNITHLLDELSLPYFFDVTLLKEFGFARTYQSKRSSILQPAERSY